MKQKMITQKIIYLPGTKPDVSERNKISQIQKYSAIMKLVWQRPGLKQTQICNILGVNKADVSRLVKIGIDENLIEKRKNCLYEGPVIKDLLNVSIKIKSIGG